MKRTLSLILALLLMLSLTSFATAEETNPWSHLDTSEYMEINYYVPGTGFEDWDEIIGLANERMMELINTKVNVTFVPYGDYGTKLSLFLAGDEDVDLIYGAPWLGFADYVTNGGYKGFDWNFVETYMPETAKNQASSSWNEMKYGDLYYGVTNNRVGIGWGGAWTRQSTLDKYGFKAEDINSYEKMIEFLDAVAKDTPETGVYAFNPQNSYPMESFYWFVTRNHFRDVNAGAANWMVWPYNTGKEFAVEDLLWFAETPEYRAFCLEMADFYKKGYFPANVISNDVLLDDNFYAGTSAIIHAGYDSAANIKDRLTDDTAVFLNAYWDETSSPIRGGYFCYAACFPPASKKTERAAIALDVMRNDPIVNRLLVGGVEGRHYTLSEDGKHYIPGPEASDFPWNSFANNASLQNDDAPSQLIEPEYQKYQDMYEAAVAPSESFPLTGFNYNAEKYTAELSAATALFNEYRFSFCFGLFGDQTEAKLDEFIAQMKALGIDDICNDYREQLSAYIAK